MAKDPEPFLFRHTALPTGQLLEKYGGNGRAPIVSRCFLDALGVGQQVVCDEVPGSKTMSLGMGGQSVTKVIACACETGCVSGDLELASCYEQMSGVQVKLCSKLEEMHTSKERVAVADDDYGGKYLKFGYAAGAGRSAPADAWLLRAHDTHMSEMAYVYAMMLPLQRFAAVCMRRAGAEPDACYFSLLRRQVERLGLPVSDYHCPPAWAVRGVMNSKPCGAHTDHDRDSPQVFIYMDHPRRDVSVGAAPNSVLGVAACETGGVTAEVSTDNSTSDVQAITGVVCNPRKSLHFTVEDDPGNVQSRALVRFLFYHNKRLADVAQKPHANIWTHTQHLMHRMPLQCPQCAFVALSPTNDPSHWLHHWDAAVCSALGVEWNCGCKI